jgi:uncharacterized protein (DUF2126 family)
MADEKETSPAHEISKDEMKFLVKTIWTMLGAPAWTKDSLITLGKVIFAKKTLKEMDDKAFAEIWPHLKVMAETLNTKFSEEADRRAAEAAEKTTGDNVGGNDDKGGKEESGPSASTEEKKPEEAAQ